LLLATEGKLVEVSIITNRSTTNQYYII